MYRRKQPGISLRLNKSLSISLGVVCLLSFLMASITWALPDEVGSSQELPSLQKTDVSQESSWDEEKDIVDAMHDKVTSSFLATADWVDSFFDDDRIVEEEDRSTLRVYTTVSKREGESVDLNVRFRLRLALPGARERLSLLVSGDDEENVRPDSDPNDFSRDVFKGRNEENTSTSLWYSFLSDDKRHLSASVGFRLSSGSLIFYAGPRYRQLFSYGEWDMRFIETMRYYTENGWESRTILDVERPVFENCLFRTTFDGTWLEDVPGYTYNTNFVLFQSLKLNRALQYEWVNTMRTRPNHQLSSTTFKVRYRQQFWKPWLFFEIVPEIQFPRERDWDLTPGIYVRLEVIFGKYRDLFKSRGMIGDHPIDSLNRSQKNVQ